MKKVTLLFVLMAITITMIFADKNIDLLEAANSGKASVVERLLKSGAKVDVKDKKGWTPLIFASHKGHKDVVAILIKKGANVNAKTDYASTSLMFAAKAGHKDIVELLIKNGADVNIKDNDKDTALMMAGKYGHKDIAQLLIKNKAEVNAKNTAGDTAASLARKQGHTELAKFLEDSGKTASKGSSKSSNKGSSNTNSSNKKSSKDSGWDIAKLDTARNVNYLSDIEKDVILEHNKARSNPKKYAEMYVKPKAALFKNGSKQYLIPGTNTYMMTNEGAAAVEECVRAMSKTTPIGIIKPSKGLSKAAQFHSKEQSKNGKTGHNSADGSDPFKRMGRYGSFERTAGENCAYGSKTGRDIVVDLLIDDGVPSRGHRENILSPDYGAAGVGYAPEHPAYGSVCVIDYAGGFNDK